MKQIALSFSLFLLSVGAFAQQALYQPGAAGGQAPADVTRVEPHSHTRCALAAAGTNNADPWMSCLLIGYKNVSAQAITGIRFEVDFITPLKDPTQPVYVEDTRKIKPGKTLMMLWQDGVYWQQYGGDKMDANVSVAKVMFEDGTFWNAPAH